MDDGNFLDLLYGAAVEPQLWVPALERLADLTGRQFGVAVAAERRRRAGSGVLARLDPDYPTLYMDHFAELNPFSTSPDPRNFVNGWEPMITTDQYWVPKDGADGIGILQRLPGPAGRALIRDGPAGGARPGHLRDHRQSLGEGRPLQRDDMDLRRRLHPHMVRAFELTEKLTAVGLMHDDMATALDHSPFGVFLLDDTGRLQRTNRAAERLLAGGAFERPWRAAHRLTRGAARQLEALIPAAASHDDACAPAAPWRSRRPAGRRRSR